MSSWLTSSPQTPLRSWRRRPEVAIGAAGLAPLRVTTVADGSGTKEQEETLVDLIAAAAGIVIGQRGRGAPVAVLRGVRFERSEEGVRAALHS